MRDDVKVDVFSNHLHASQQVRRNGAYEDAVVVFIERLHLCEVGLYSLIFLHVDVGQEDGLLYSVASHPL